MTKKQTSAVSGVCLAAAAAFAMAIVVWRGGDATQFGPVATWIAISAALIGTAVALAGHFRSQLALSHAIEVSEIAAKNRDRDRKMEQRDYLALCVLDLVAAVNELREDANAFLRFNREDPGFDDCRARLSRTITRKVVPAARKSRVAALGLRAAKLGIPARQIEIEAIEMDTSLMSGTRRSRNIDIGKLEFVARLTRTLDAELERYVQLDVDKLPEPFWTASQDG